MEHNPPTITVRATGRTIPPLPDDGSGLRLDYGFRIDYPAGEGPRVTYNPDQLEPDVLGVIVHGLATGRPLAHHGEPATSGAVVDSLLDADTDGGIAQLDADQQAGDRRREGRS